MSKDWKDKLAAVKGKIQANPRATRGVPAPKRTPAEWQAIIDSEDAKTLAEVEGIISLWQTGHLTAGEAVKRIQNAVYV